MPTQRTIIDEQLTLGDVHCAESLMHGARDDIHTAWQLINAYVMPVTTGMECAPSVETAVTRLRSSYTKLYDGIETLRALEKRDFPPLIPEKK